MIELVNVLEDFGLIIKGSLKLNRWVAVTTRDKPRRRNGRYYFTGEICFFKNWATDESSYWFANQDKFKTKSRQERQEYLAQLDAKRKQFETEDRKSRLIEVNKSFSILKIKATHHPYLERKQAHIQPDFKLDFQRNLIIPICNIDKVLVGYQRIDIAGNKKFKTGSIMRGGFYPIKPATLEVADLSVIFLCEGYATGSSIYQALNEELDAVDFGVLCCFSASNIDTVYDALVNKFFKKSIVHIKDQDDAGNKSKVQGFTVGFTPGQDANDIACQFGLDTLASIIKSKLFDLSMERYNNEAPN